MPNRRKDLMDIREIVNPQDADLRPAMLGSERPANQSGYANRPTNGETLSRMGARARTVEGGSASIGNDPRTGSKDAKDTSTTTDCFVGGAVSRNSGKVSMGRS